MNLENEFLKLKEKLQTYRNNKYMFKNKAEGFLALFVFGGSMIMPLLFGMILNSFIDSYAPNSPQLHTYVTICSFLLFFTIPVVAGNKFIKSLEKKYNYKENLNELTEIVKNAQAQKTLLAYLYEKNQNDKELQSLTDDLVLDFKNEQYNHALYKIFTITDYLGNKHDIEKKNKEVKEYLEKIELNLNTKEINGTIKSYL